ncbi:hypothetical protein [Photobacterium leiognathi]|uniref:hypothetical protein n=1 Tax=Photobacterium leiognathi TaxID=553611 RepID=UPI00273A151D|nr:hypothetical protein [Photobacterium leiognathi]
MNKINFLIVSDLHSTINEDSKNESMLIFDKETKKSKHGQACIDYIKDLNVDIDYVVCPGDISIPVIIEDA